MKKKLTLALLAVSIFVFLFAITIFGATTNEFGTLETSDTIDLTDMSTDTKARVVLYDGTEYHTYPAQYIVTSAEEMAYNFEKINTAFEKSYAVDSVIRIEIPNTVKVIVSGLFNYGKNNNLKEVYFPSDSNVYKFNWGCFEKNTGLEKINIPASLTEYNGTNHFCECTALEEITFDTGYTVSYIPEKFLNGCSSLETIVFPNCVTEIRGGAFGSCSKLKTIVFGANLQTMAGSMSDCATSGSVWYLPATFYASNVTSEPPSNMFHWKGNQTNSTSGNDNNPKNITFVYTGTKAQAEALQARFKAADAATGENCVGLSRLYNATLCTEAEYEQLTGKKVGDVVTGYYLIYDYNPCKAFYNNEHNYSAEQEKFLGAEYLTDYVVATTCQRCNENVIKETIATAIFTNKGYSYASYGTGKSFSFGISLNEQAYNDYKEHNPEAKIKFGFIIGSVESDDNNILNADGTSKLSNYVITDFTTTNYQKLNRYDLIMHGLSDDDVGMQFYCGAYIIEDSSVYYIGNTTTIEAVSITYDKLPVANS